MRSYAEFMEGVHELEARRSARLSAWCTWLDHCARTDHGPWWDHVEEPLERIALEVDSPFFDIHQAVPTLRVARLACEAMHLSATDGLILDPLCGDGRWIASLAAASETMDWLENTWLIDPDPFELAVAMMRVTAVSAAEDMEAFFNRIAERAVCADSLDIGTGVQRQLFESDATQNAIEVDLPRGFDTVITSPRNLEIDHERRESLRQQFSSARSHFPYRIALCERAFDLARPGGRVGFVLPASLFRREYGRALVAEVLERYKVRDIIYFEEASRPDRVCISCEKSPAGLNQARIHRVDSEESADDVVEVMEGSVFESSRNAGRVAEAIEAALMNRATRGIVAAIHEQELDLLESLLNTPAGRTTSPGILSLWWADSKTDARLTAPMVHAEDILPFRLRRARPIYWPYEKPGRPWIPLPEQLEHRLWPFKTALRERKVFGRKAHEVGHWYEHLEHYPARMTGPRVAVSAYGKQVSAALVPEGFAVSSSGIVLNFDDYEPAYTVLAVLNSTFGTFWLRTHGFVTQSDAVELNVGVLNGTPIPNSMRGELAGLARRLERLFQGLSPTQHPTSLQEFGDWFEREKTNQAGILTKIEERLAELDQLAYRAFKLVPSEGVKLDETMLDDDPHVEHLQAFRNETVDQGVARESIEADLALQMVEKHAAGSTIVDISLLAASRGVEADWLIERLLPHAIEWNPLRVLGDNGLEVLEQRENVRLRQRRSDESGEDGPSEWLLLDSEHFSGRPLPTLTKGQTDAHHWRYLSSQFRATARLYYLGDVSDLVESHVVALVTHDPADHLAIAKESIRHAQKMGFYPPGPATLEDPRMLGLIGRLLYERQSIRRTTKAEALEAVFRTHVADGSGLSELVDSYRKWLFHGSQTLQSAALEAQLDLAKLVELEAFFSTRREASLREAALRFVSEGWTFAQTRSVLEALAASGRLEATSEDHWRIREE